jgi:hypothetical protein
MPTPFPGFDVAEIKQLINISLARMNSPRLKEVDTAAALMKVIYLNYCSGLQWRITFENATVEIEESKQVENKQPVAESKILFMRIIYYICYLQFLTL